MKKNHRKDYQMILKSLKFDKKDQNKKYEQF